MFTPVIPINCLMENIPQSLYDVDARAINGLEQRPERWALLEPRLRFFTFVVDVIIQYQGDTFYSVVVPLKLLQYGNE
ncbi:hypothetical protein A8L45_22900 [Veronia pacifica]|uniref:Uncharacterized protein n=1 Tax=Veronia pacifica TaxID=1080227 RepID=A0A1C3E711_9GAMM|nr:hypothetical protein A8L45_22900 [Veronia pacifica]